VRGPSERRPARGCRAKCRQTFGAWLAGGGSFRLRPRPCGDGGAAGAIRGALDGNSGASFEVAEASITRQARAVHRRQNSMSFSQRQAASPSTVLAPAALGVGGQRSGRHADHPVGGGQVSSSTASGAQLRRYHKVDQADRFNPGASAILCPQRSGSMVRFRPTSP
jgi:hypothetical protein